MGAYHYVRAHREEYKDSGNVNQLINNIKIYNEYADHRIV